jgi:uncharacterized protein
MQIQFHNGVVSDRLVRETARVAERLAAIGSTQTAQAYLLPAGWRGPATAVVMRSATWPRLASGRVERRLRVVRCRFNRVGRAAAGYRAGMSLPRAAATVALVFLTALVLIIGVAWLGQRRLIYFPDRAYPTPPESVAEVLLHTRDGLTLRAWRLSPDGPNGHFAVLVAPGNAGHRGDRLPLARALAARGFTVLLLDYRGYGGNPGQPTEAGLAMDARAALHHLMAGGFPLARVVYFGESLGAAVVGELATEHPPAGLLLRSPFTELAAVGTQHYPWLPVRRLLRDRHPLAEYITRIPVPTTVVYGTADSIVAPEQSRAVAHAAAGPVSAVAIPGADHNDPVLVEGDPVIDAVAALAGG